MGAKLGRLNGVMELLKKEGRGTTGSKGIIFNYICFSNSSYYEKGIIRCHAKFVFTGSIWPN
ncbi:hypothetical protein LBMAG22_04600 [Bacteroidota bacterium]|nr:hypothetical protein LBMAG22_04600 [Bacteroidota bacterium]